MVGIPRGLLYYLEGKKWELFFKILNIKYIISPETNKEILELGTNYASSEMCLSLKNYLGHVAIIKDKCDYILVPHISNYNLDDQMCTNFMALYDIVNNMFNINIISYDVDVIHHQKEIDGFIKMGIKLGKTKSESKKAYLEMISIIDKLNKVKITHNGNIKILLLGHKYNILDNYIGKPIIKLLQDNDIDIVYSSDYKLSERLNNYSHYSKMLYWKYIKEEIGSINLSKIDGIIFISSFPCGLDSEVNEIVMHKINIPYLNIVVDDITSSAGIETRIESFIDILKGKLNV